MAAGKIIARTKNILSPLGKARRDYRGYWENYPLDENLILVEPQQGRSLSGNMFYVVRELVSNPAYSSFRIVVVATGQALSNFKSMAANYSGFDRCEFIIIHTDGYMKALATAKYLITDTAFATYYIKKDGQIILNTWHGTPLKAMGRKDNSGLHSLGNIQKNLAISDFLLFPNYYMAQHMLDDYMLHGTCKAKVLFCGYPRNIAFFDDIRAIEVRRLIAPNASKLYAYMPTWRETKIGDPSIEILSILLQMDQRLHDDELMMVSLHPLQKAGVDFSMFKRVVEFPNSLETYDILNACDLLITDYSSVMFDFAVSKKKIVLFDYDSDIYTKDRGLYLELDALPFVHVKDMQALFEEIRSDQDLSNREAFLREFCPFERPSAAQDVCDVLTNPNTQVSLDPMPEDSRKNVLIYGGNLARNGMTTSLLNLLRHIDTSEYHFFLTFNTRKVASNREVLLELPDSISYIPCIGKSNMTLQEKISQYLYGKRQLSIEKFDQDLRYAYRTDIRRTYGDLPFDAVIQFTGYDFKRIYQFAQFNCKKIIFIHNDMVSEATKKGNQRLDMLRYAFQQYDTVAVVSEDILPATKSIAPDTNNYTVVHNYFDYKRVRSLAKQPIAFDENTTSNVSLKYIEDLFDGKSKVIVSIGRYSPEKQHRKLIDAFYEEWKADSNLRLIIIGGGTYLDQYDETVEYAASLPCSSSIVCIRNMSNPYSILRRAHGFILSSSYEGFGLVLLEADALGIPVVSTDIPGPRSIFKKRVKGLVPCTQDGIQAGIHLLVENEAPRLDIDFESYNNDALNAFLKLLP